MPPAIIAMPIQRAAVIGSESTMAEARMMAMNCAAVKDWATLRGTSRSSIVVAMIIYVAALSIPLYRVGRRPA